MNDSSSSIIGLVVIVAIVFFIVRSRRKKRAAQSAKMAQAIALQNIVSNTPSNKLILSPKQLSNAVTNYVGRHNKDMAAAVERLGKADNPKAFYEQLDRIAAIITDYRRLDQVQPGVIQPGPDAMERSVNDSLPDDINAMIDRAWLNTQMAAAKYTKDETRLQKYQVFFNTMDVFSNRMTSANLDHLNDLRRSVGL